MKSEHNAKDHLKFIEIWGLVHNNIRMFKYWIDKGELSIPETRLLRAFYLFKKNKKQECLELIKSKMSDDPFLEGVRFYLIGLTYNQFGHYHYAVENLEKSIAYFEESRELDFILNPLSLLAVVYCNRREEVKMAGILDKLKDLDPKTTLRKIQIQYSEFSYFYLSHQFEKAKRLYAQVTKENVPEFSSFKPYFMILLFMFHVREKNYNKCYELMAEYSELNEHVVKVNYIYNKALLDLLVHEKPLYVYASDFADFPELHHQLEVIKNLKVGDLEGAKNFWDRLSKHNPDLYQANFEYMGEESLFLQSLQRYHPSSGKLQIQAEELAKFSTNLLKLDYIFTHATIPMSQGDLIKLIWKEEISELGKTKLRRLIADYAKKYHKKIKSYQSTYQLDKKVS